MCSESVGSPYYDGLPTDLPFADDLHRSYLSQLTLYAAQASIDAVFCQQLVVRAHLHQFAFVQDKEAVSKAQGGKTVRDGKSRPSLHKTLECFLYLRFGFSVNRGGRLIEDENSRIFQDGPGNRQTLTFSA